MILDPLKTATWHEFLKDQTADKIVSWIYQNFENSKIAFGSSFGAEDQALIHLILVANPKANVFTLDTGRLPQETYDVIQKTQRKFKCKIEFLFPRTEDVEKLLNQKGPNSFYESMENRKECCFIRKVQPLETKLSKLDVWVTGLRKQQTVTREDLKIIEWDQGNQLIKISPLANWSEKDVWDYIKLHKLPYNALHDQNYPSIGCSPCTRAIKSGEDIRSGRWWWESSESKECGLHFKNGKLVQTNPYL